MIILLLISGVVSLVFGIMFLVAPAGFWQKFTGLFNKPVLLVEGGLRAYNFPAGFIFLVLGTWLIFLVIADPVLWFFHIVGVAFVVAGLLYIFVPDWLVWLSSVSGKEIITFDQVAIASRTSLGVVLILVSIYIFLKLLIVLRIQ
ncbi:hypothetical protein ACFL4J_00640 [Candidatus Margulisiibacteriota bacterium]